MKTVSKSDILAEIAGMTSTAPQDTSLSVRESRVLHNDGSNDVLGKSAGGSRLAKPTTIKLSVHVQDEDCNWSES